MVCCVHVQHSSKKNICNACSRVMHFITSWVQSTNYEIDHSESLCRLKMKMRNPITDRPSVRMLSDIFSLVDHLSKCVLLASSPHIMIPRLFPTSFSKSWPPGHIWNNPSSADSLFSRRGGKVGRGKWGRPILSPRVLPCDSRSGTHVQAHVLAEQGFVYSIQTNSIRHQKLLLQRSQLSKSLGWRHDVTATPVWV